MPRVASQTIAKFPTDDESFIHAVAALMIRMGMRPIAARMYGYLLLSREPLSLDELVTGLGVSKSSASVATRVLERFGITRRFTTPGTKRVRYGISGQCDWYLAEQIRFFDSMGHLLKERATAHPRDRTSELLQGLGDFYLRLKAATEEVYNDKSRNAPPQFITAVSDRAQSTRQRQR
jgi:HTH-type transcriptional regulator, osmoprotectant uptake regulator